MAGNASVLLDQAADTAIEVAINSLLTTYSTLKRYFGSAYRRRAYARSCRRLAGANPANDQKKNVTNGVRVRASGTAGTSR